MMFTGIYDLWIGTWWKIHETGDLSLLLKEKRKVTKKIERDLIVRWKEIKDEYFNKIALTSKLQDYMMKLVQLEVIHCDIILNQDNSMGSYWRTMYRVVKAELESMERSTGLESQSNWRNKAHVEKHMGFHINIYRTTMVEFHEYLNLLEEEYHRMKQSAARAKVKAHGNHRRH